MVDGADFEAPALTAVSIIRVCETVLVRVWGDVRPGVTAGVRGRTFGRPNARPVVRPDGRRRCPCRQRHRKKNHLIEAAPFGKRGRLDQM